MNEPFMLRALAAGLGLALIAAPLGCFIVWRRMAYFGETVSQTGLIGVALGIGLAVEPTLSVLVATLAMSLLLLLLTRQSKIPIDTILGVLAHTALAVGVIVNWHLSPARSDLLMTTMFGDVISITSRDLLWIYIGGAGALVALFWLWRPLLAISVHEDMAAAEGVDVARTHACFVLLLAFVVAISLKIVGALVTIAFLIIPAAAARPFSETPEQMAFFATIFALLSAALGLLISYTADIPGGPAIVVVLASIFAVSTAATLWRTTG